MCFCVYLPVCLCICVCLSIQLPSVRLSVFVYSFMCTHVCVFVYFLAVHLSDCVHLVVCSCRCADFSATTRRSYSPGLQRSKKVFFPASLTWQRREVRTPECRRTPDQRYAQHVCVRRLVINRIFACDARQVANVSGMICLSIKILDTRES